MVLTPRRWRQVLEKQLLGGEGGNKARSPGRARRKPLKPSRAGMPGDPGATVVTNARVFYSTRAAAGASGTRHSPLPTWGRRLHAQLGRIARRECERISKIGATSLRGAERRSNPFLLSYCGMDCFASLAMTVGSLECFTEPVGQARPVGSQGRKSRPFFLDPCHAPDYACGRSNRRIDCYFLKAS